MRRYTCLLAALALLVASSSGAIAQECDKTFDSTFALIQEAIFEGRGCTSATCHVGPNPASGLGLDGDDAWSNLIDAEVSSLSPSAALGMKRVVPGQKDKSLLWFNLAAATLPEVWQAPLRAMPIGLPGLSLDELEAVRLWIEQGAPNDGVVPGTDELLDACLPEPEPIRITPLTPPEPGTGVQLVMPQWTLPPGSEDEVCFVSYFDVTDQVPERFRGADGESFRYVRNQIRQNPGSHHLIVNLYQGDAPIDDPSWGAFTCKGGDDAGSSCDPVDSGACSGGLCGSEVKTSLACTGFGPGDVFTSGVPFSGTQEASSSVDFVDGVFAQVPAKGILVWNSHSFNLTAQDSVLEAWLNFDFAEKQESPAIGIFDIRSIFKMDAAPFTADEVCAHHQLLKKARVFELNSHMHQRGQRFRIFDSMFTCNGGANDGAACSPFGADETFQTDGQCGGAECRARAVPQLGDCDGDLSVGINDLIVAVNVALGRAPANQCVDTDSNSDGAISVSELVAAVKRSLAGDELIDPEGSLIYESVEYSDPVVARYDPPLEFPDGDASRERRTLTFCGMYDNGFVDPDTVKRQSTSPGAPNGVHLGGPCDVPTGCTEGNVGAACSGTGADARDASCDSSPGAGDGVCDACALTGGVTTEDEMFVLIGTYFRK